MKLEQGMKEDYLDPGEMVQYEGDGGAYDDSYYEDPAAVAMDFDNSAILNSKGEKRF